MHEHNAHVLQTHMPMLLLNQLGKKPLSFQYETILQAW